MRLSDFAKKGSYLLFDFPLYTRIKIDISPETTEEVEILDYDENDIPHIVHHMNFYENKDVRYLKMLTTQGHNCYHYCPFCKKELYVTIEEHPSENEFSKSLITTYSYMSMSEEFEGYDQYATTEAAKRYGNFTEQIFDENKTIKINLECTAKDKHKFYVIFQLTKDNNLMKTGQYPSILDFDNSLKEYKKFLKDKDITKELTKAEILKTHNMGVGAFLYLRRIFEKLIFEKFDQAKIDKNIDQQEEATFRNDSTKDKVKTLHEKGYLPAFVYETNSFVYSILSKGVHQLDEEECNSHYDTLRLTVLLILKEQVDMEKNEKLKKSTKNQLNKIHAKLSQQKK